METSEFQDKVALVTGASSGIGSAIATRLGRAGATVAVHYDSHEENAAAVASTITSAGGKAFIVGGDVAKVDDAKSIVKAVVDRCGELTSWSIAPAFLNMRALATLIQPPSSASFR
jgi:NAD(P)-dependent dehydrogenase (short-subunit alcohol dehydrogenase family)